MRHYRHNIYWYITLQQIDNTWVGARDKATRSNTEGAFIRNPCVIWIARVPEMRR